MNGCTDGSAINRSATPPPPPPLSLFLCLTKRTGGCNSDCTCHVRGANIGPCHMRCVEVMRLKWINQSRHAKAAKRSEAGWNWCLWPHMPPTSQILCLRLRVAPQCEQRYIKATWRRGSSSGNNACCSVACVLCHVCISVHRAGGRLHWCHGCMHGDLPERMDCSNLHCARPPHNRMTVSIGSCSFQPHMQRLCMAMHGATLLQSRRGLQVA